MKRIIIIALCLCGILSVACSTKKETPVNPANISSLRLENAQLIFNPDGGVDTIRVHNGVGVKAEPKFSWCTTNVIGDSLVRVVIEPYAGLESRYCQINITTESTLNSVVVQQSGVYIQRFDDTDIPLKNGASVITRTFNSNATFTAETDADWIHLSVDNSSLTINIDENTGKEYREAQVHWAVGQLKDSILVSQFDAVDAGMMGDYTWKGKNVKQSNRDWTINANLSAGTSEDSYTLTLTSNTYSLSIPVKMDKQTLLFPLGQPIGTYTTSRGVVHTVIPVIAQGTAAIKYANVTNSGDYKFIFDKNDDGKWVATADHSPYIGLNFQFANWLKTDDYLSVNSQTNGIYLQNITLEQK